MTQLVPAAALALLGAASGYAFYDQRQKQHAMADTETTTTDALTEGQVKLTGTVEPIETVESPVDGTESVIVDWQLRATPGDHDEAGTEEVIEGIREAAFKLSDQAGEVRVDPEGSQLVVSGENTTSEFHQHVQLEEIETLDREIQGDHGGSDREGVHVRADGTLMAERFNDEYDSYTLKHEVIQPGDEVYVLGNATRENGTWVIGHGEGKFLISDQSEEEVTADLERKKWIPLAAAVVFAVGSLYFLLLA